MSEEMAAKKKQEEEERKKEEEELKEDLKEMDKDCCPHCLQPVSSYPYLISHPTFAWIECASCGIVYSPRSIRNIKIRKSKKVQVVGGGGQKLFVPSDKPIL